MRTLVTGSTGHLGEGLLRILRGRGGPAVGLDLLASPFTDFVGSIEDRSLLRGALKDVRAVIHTATLHKPHVRTHTRQAFVDTNIAGTLALLEESVAAGVERFVFTSTTSAFGRALSPPSGAPAAWVTEDVASIPKNIYGATKTAAEDLCELVHRDEGLPCLILRTSRFFPEDDDSAAIRDRYEGDNAKVNELLYRRADLEDIVSAHLAAVERAPRRGFGKYIVSATTPFAREDVRALRDNAPSVVRRLFPHYEQLYADRGWTMFPSVDRVYDSARASQDLQWTPRWTFAYALTRLAEGKVAKSELALTVGAKGYHAESFEGEPYPT
ncbi:MAG: NAD(P)-dependent oxidoreductase [Myxococcota bacterium]